MILQALEAYQQAFFEKEFLPFLTEIRLKLDFKFLTEAIEEGRAHRFWLLTTYTTLANYQANASGFNSTVFINTPMTTDSTGNVLAIHPKALITKAGSWHYLSTRLTTKSNTAKIRFVLDTTLDGGAVGYDGCVLDGPPAPATLVGSSDFKLCSDQLRPIPHDAQPHSDVASHGGGKGDPVVSDGQDELAVTLQQNDADLFGLAVFDGIDDGFFRSLNRRFEQRIHSIIRKHCELNRSGRFCGSRICGGERDEYVARSISRRTSGPRDA